MMNCCWEEPDELVTSGLVRRRVVWSLLGVCFVVVGVCVAAQLFIDGKVRTLASPHGASVSSSIGAISIQDIKAGGGGGAFASADTRIVSSIVRRSCSGQWTFGLGARIEMREIRVALAVSAERDIELDAPFACWDVKWEGSIREPAVQIALGSAVATSGFCGPELSQLALSWSSPSRLHIEATLRDGSRCLPKLAFLAPQYPDALIPEQVRIRFESENVDWKKPELAGKSAVALVAELSRRFENAGLNLHLNWQTNGGEQVSACIRRAVHETHSEFEIELGLTEEALLALTRPFLSDDNRRVLSDLRTARASCDGKAQGLSFSSDLHEVRQQGKQLQRREEAAQSAPGFRTVRCQDQSESSCRYQFGVIQFGEDGRLVRPEQLEAITRSAGRFWREKPLVLVFLHGWRHDADPSDKNIQEFESFVAAAAARVRSSEEGRRRVLGIYLSWPGRMYDSPSANKLATFWNRLDTSRNLGEKAGDLGLVLQRLEEDLGRGNDESGGKLVLIAHSMGADPLLHALATIERQNEFEKLWILINPALSVSRLAEFRKLGLSLETPLLSYGSVADQVTQQLFPLGAAIQFKGTTRAELAAFSTTINNAPQPVQKYLRPGKDGLEVCETRAQALCPLDDVARFGQPGLTAISVDPNIIPGHSDYMTPAFARHLLGVILAEASVGRW